MSTKFVIQKFEDGIYSKSLCMFFDNDDCKFGMWLDGKIDLKEKDIENSRLIVKTISGESVVSDFDIDSCAREMSSSFNTSVLSRVWENKSENESNCPNIKISLNGDCEIINAFPKDEQNLNILEFSLEKVKENNARIMENINKLNRTLNYTKKKEMFDITCTKSMRSYPCEICGTAFVYETGLRRHCAMRHSNLDMQARWQIVWTCTECFQVWPHQELALKHSNYCCKAENTDCTREIKTSLLLQCEFCEKVYTSIPRLLKHSRTHSTDKNYECNACKVSFESYKTAEQHWILCPWLLMCYKFSLPRMLLCNVCDRKFRNYDHLYNHRYKVGHFISKLCNDNNPNSIPNMKYQCEYCGLCFQGSLQLQTHKNQCHPCFNPLALYNKCILKHTEE